MTSLLYILRNKRINLIVDLILFEMNDKRSVVKFYYEQNFSPSEIFELLENNGFNRMFIHRTIKRLNETGSVADRKRSRRPRSARTVRRIKAVQARVRRNPRRSQRKLAPQMGTSRRTIQRIIKGDLVLTPYKRRKVHGLTMQQRGTRLERSKALLRRYADRDVERIVFSDEKLFVIEEHLNSQNDRVYAAAFEDIPEHVRTVQRFQKPASVMVWGAVSSRSGFC
jgi:inhibitor of nuclear factor kappa-B kinase subunit alpha